MRILVCGDRNWDDKEIIWDFLDGLTGAGWCLKPPPSTIIQGGAKGADEYARTYREQRAVACNPDYLPTVETFYPLWAEFGKAAGPMRNQDMLEKGKPDVVLAFHDNIHQSKGTKDMVDRAVAAGVPTYIISRAGRKED